MIEVAKKSKSLRKSKTTGFGLGPNTSFNTSMQEEKWEDFWDSETSLVYKAKFKDTQNYIAKTSLKTNKNKSTTQNSNKATRNWPWLILAMGIPQENKNCILF